MSARICFKVTFQGPLSPRSCEKICTLAGFRAFDLSGEDETLAVARLGESGFIALDRYGKGFELYGALHDFDDPQEQASSQELLKKIKIELPRAVGDIKVTNYLENIEL